MNDSEAVQRLKTGDSSGLEHLVLRYQVKAIRSAFLITHDEHQAKDVVQDTFLTSYQRIRSFDEGRPFELWFMVASVAPPSKLPAIRPKRYRLTLLTKHCWIS